MQKFENLLRSKRLLWVNLSLVSFLIGSLITTAVYVGCVDKQTGIHAAKTSNPVLDDSEAIRAATAMQRAFRNIARFVGPAVVSINATKVVTYRNPYNRLFQDDFFRHFFGDRYPQRQQQQRRTPTLGSGFVIDEKGYIITNHHVIQQADEITVIFSDGRRFKAKVIGSDKETDLALLKIEPKGKIPVVRLGDSDKLEVGDWVVAIGNPFNLPNTFTAGIVSAKSRGDRVGMPYQNFIQTDTAINPGNSGGPLVNIRGEVVGINTMIYTRTGGSLGIGFAIPVNISKSVVQSLIKNGKFERGYLGIYPGKIDEKMRRILKLDADTGVIVNSVVSGGPGEKAGLKAGDVILSIDGKKITSVSQLMRLVATLPIGKKVKLEVQRKWQKTTVQLEIGKRPGETAAAGNNGSEQGGDLWLGMKVVPVSSLNALQLRRLRIDPDEGGVVITGLTDDAPDSELQPGTVIRAINYVPVKTLQDYRNFIKQHGKGSEFLFEVVQQGMKRFIAVRKG